MYRFLLLLPALAACAPLPTRAVAPTRVTVNRTYPVPAPVVGRDHPVLAAVVALAPTVPVEPGRQPWRAEEITTNGVVLRSNATVVDVTTFAASVRTAPREMSFAAISTAGSTTLTATYSSTVAASAQVILDALDARFSTGR
ncbi:hypothetical protein [Deinococcus rufus]|uniref:ABC-type transport auxiliary lipoprotein component domain-containing protein n=1 Tax=Deinococcus rufus TaxID=2136097 RepID=A0ABV7ZAY9_9DEIO